MIKKIIILLILISSTIPCAALAEDRISSTSFIDIPMKYTLDLELVKIDPMPPRTPGEFGEKQYWLTKDTLAPFDGVLLNPEAMAFILSEYKASYDRSVLAINKQREMDLSVLNLEVGKLQLEVSTLTTKSEIIIKGRDDEIKRLQDINKEQTNDRSGFKRKLYVGLGTSLAGLVIGFIAGGIILH